MRSDLFLFLILSQLTGPPHEILFHLTSSVEKEKAIAGSCVFALRGLLYSRWRALEWWQAERLCINQAQDEI